METLTVTLFSIIAAVVFVTCVIFLHKRQQARKLEAEKARLKTEAVQQLAAEEARRKAEEEVRRQIEEEARQ